MKQNDATNRLVFKVPQPGSDEALLEHLFQRLGSRYVLKRAARREGLVWVLTHIAENLLLDADALLASESHPSKSTIQCAEHWRAMSAQLFTLVSAWEMQAGRTKESLVDDIGCDEVEGDGVIFERDEDLNIKTC